MEAAKSQSPLALIGVVLGLIGTGVGIWTQFDKRLQDKELEAIRLQLSQRQDDRLERGAERDYLLKVTERVIDALGSPSADKQKVATVLVDTLGEGDVKAQLRVALLAVAPPDAKGRLEKTIEEERVWDELQTSLQAPAKSAAVVPGRAAGIEKQAAGSGRTRVDIFWCEGGNGEAHQRQADGLYREAVASGAFGLVRVRPLPESVNRRPGYSIVSNLIRHQDVEKAIAARLRALPAAKGFGMQQIGFATPDYISAFFCASGN